MEKITPDFEKDFFDLCCKHGVNAAFFTVDRRPHPDGVNETVNFYTGGHRETCGYIRACIQLAMSPPASEKIN